MSAGNCKGDTNKGVFLIRQEADGDCLVLNDKLHVLLCVL